VSSDVSGSATMLAPAEKPRFPRSAAIEVARELVSLLRPCCSEMVVAGSLRRRKQSVGDVELLFKSIAVTGPDPDDLFGNQGRAVTHDAMEIALRVLLEKGVLRKRLSVTGNESWGARNKLAVHVASGIPVDLFAASHENWWNLLVCRTGGMQSNLEICNAAIDAGWKWNPYGEGFSRPNPERVGWRLIKEVHSEREVFEFVGLPFREPWERK